MKADIQHIYLESKQWLNELEFLDFERNFFQKILNTCDRQPSPLNKDKTAILRKKLFDLEVDMHDLRNQTLSNMTSSELISEGLVSLDKEEFQFKYQWLDQQLKELFSSFRTFKTELLSNTCQAVKISKSQFFENYLYESSRLQH